MEKEHSFIIIAAILYGTIIAGAQFLVNLGLSLFEISLCRVVITSIILLPIVLIKHEYMIKKETFLFFVKYGLLGAILSLTQFGGVVFGVPVAIVVLLLYSQPIWTTIFGRLMLNEQINPKKVAAVSIAVLGVIILLRSWTIESIGSLAGIISALLGGIFLSLWIIWGRKSGINKYHYITTTIGWAGFSSIWLLLLWPIMNFFIHEPSITRLSVSFPLHYWLYFVAFTLIACIIPHFLLYRGLYKVQASIAGIIMLLEPVSASILAAILFSQLIGLHIILGGALILLSNYLIIHKAKSKNNLK